MIVHDEQRLASLGYTELGIKPTEEMPGFGLLRKLHIEYNVQYGGITTFRTAGGWKFYRSPCAIPGFVDKPFLPA